MALLSSSVSTPAFQSATAHAFDSGTSNGQSRKSMPMELFSASNAGAGPPPNRPPQSLCDLAGAPSRRRAAAHAIASDGSGLLASVTAALTAQRPSPDP